MSKISDKSDKFLLNYSYLFWGPLWDTVYFAHNCCTISLSLSVIYPYW